MYVFIYIYIYKTDNSNTGEMFWKLTVAPYGLKTSKIMAIFARFYLFFWGRSRVNEKFILLSLTCKFWKDFYLCILGCSITLFGGDSCPVETTHGKLTTLWWMRMDKFIITIYVATVISRWSENGIFLHSYKRIYNKKLRYEHHNKNFKEIILRV